LPRKPEDRSCATSWHSSDSPENRNVGPRDGSDWGRRTVGKLHVNVHSSETGLSGWNRYPLCREGKKWASAGMDTTSDEAANTTDSSLSTYVQLNHRTLGRGRVSPLLGTGRDL